jgi:hypothetical protein
MVGINMMEPLEQIILVAVAVEERIGIMSISPVVPAVPASSS